MTRLSKWMVALLFVAAALHAAVAIVQSEWLDFARGGLWDTVSATDDPAMSTLWFALAGVGLFGIAILTRRVALGTRRVPADTAWILFAIGIPTSVLQPASGGWLIMGIGVLSLVASRQRLTDLDPTPSEPHPGLAR